VEDKEIKSFSLPALLIVTGISFLLFALGFRILDGDKMKLFLEIGFISFVAGVVARCYMLIARKQNSKKQAELLNA
jgi:hypothetical protein